MGRNPNPVWRIRPGWRWRFPSGVREGLGNGILEFSDQSLEGERRLHHEAFGGRFSDDRLGVVREVNLPVVVRCPKCHRLRYVRPEVVVQPVLLRA